MSDGMMSESVSRRISALRWPACLVVILQHAIQDSQFVGEYTKTVEWLAPLTDNPWHWVDAVVYSLLGIGVVPMFFLFSGYLHYARPRPYFESLRKRLPRLLVPMTLWTVFFIVIALVIAPHVGLSARYEFLCSSDPMRWLPCLVGDYSHPFKAGFCCPSVYHLWYLRDLAALVLMGPIIGWGLRRAPIVFFALVCASAFGEWRPLIVGTTALMFYSLGAFCGLRKIDFFAIVDRYCPWPLLALALAVQIVVMRRLGTSITLNPVVGCFISMFFLLKVSSVFVANERRYSLLHRLDRQSFFLYCCHGGTVSGAVFILTALVMPYDRPWMVAVGSFLAFATNATFCSALGLGLERWCPRLFALLTGGRK